MVIPRDLLPFKVGPVQTDKKTGKRAGRGVRVKFTTPEGVPVTLNCLLPKSVTLAELGKAIKDSKDSRWRGIINHLPKARPVPDASRLHASSAEGAGAVSAPDQPVLADGVGESCTMIVIDFFYESYGSWIYVHISFEVCYEAGGEDAWGYVIPYCNDPYVYIDANKYQITQLDTVNFHPVWYSPFGIPTIQGWAWQPAYGTSDPWTWASPCQDPNVDCRISVHGSGTMSYTGDFGQGNVLTATVNIGAFPPRDAGDEPGDVDEPSDPPYGGDNDNNDNTEEAEQVFGKLSGPFAPEPLFLTSDPISVLQSTFVMANAILSPDWVYTQGCYRCAGQAYEEPKNLAARYGDCTDFVWAMVEATLGSSWNHAIIRTIGFNTYGAAALASYGYMLVDSATVRMGDVVVRTPISAGGHAGIFMGWGVGGHPIGWANNGLPAKPGRQRVDGPTNATSFKQRSGEVTKFFRPVVP